MQITILGSGFGALTAVREVRQQAPEADIQVISPRAELLYYPSLIWLPQDLRQPDDLKIDLRAFFERQRVTHVPASVTGVSEGGRMVHTEQGDYRNDGLIIASGGRFIKKLPGIEHILTPCAGIEPVMEYRERLANMAGGTIAMGFGGNPKEPAAMRGGPMFEFIFNLDTMLRQQQRREQFDIVFFHPSDQPGQRLGTKVPNRLLQKMEQRGIKLHIGSKVKGFSATEVHTEQGSFHADLILFMPGMTGPAWLADSDLPQSDGGLIAATATAQVSGLSKTYVAGDAGSFPGPKWQAKQAHAADLQATTAARNLVRELHDQPATETFKHEIVCVVDTGRDGMFIKRTEQRQTMLPPLRLMHYAKRWFEQRYLKQYR